MADPRRAAAAVALAALLPVTACASPPNVAQTPPASPSPSASASASAAPTPTASTTASATASATPTASTTPDGLAGSALVKRVERHLVELGYPSGPVDGTIGTRTRQALCAWRDINGAPGGRRGSVTVAEATAILRGDAHPPADRPDGLYINKTCQVLLQVRDGAYRRVVRASTAAPGYVTPNGEGVVWRKWAGWHESSLYPDGWMYDAIYFRRDHPGVALHGSRTNDLVTPYPDSHGCTRVWRPDIEKVFAETPIGSRVLVYGAYVG